MIAAPAAILLLVLAPQGDVFDQLDKNADGRIDQSELPSNGGLIRRVLLGKDANGDGVITRNEFLGKVKLAGTPSPKPGDMRLRPLDKASTPVTPADKQPSGPPSTFDRLDRNGDGVLALDELPEAQRQIFARLFRGRERLSREQFAEILKPNKPANPKTKAQPLFAMLDKDANGVVSRAEIDKALADPKLIKASGLDVDVFQSALRTSKQAQFTEVELNDLLMPILFGRELRQYDRNGDGLINLTEVPTRFRGGIARLLKVGNLSQREPVAITKYVELFKAARGAAIKDSTAPPKKLDNIPAAFKILDENRDGIITPDELSDIAQRLQRLDANLDGGLSLDEFVGDPNAAKPQSVGDRRFPVPRTGSAPKKLDSQSDVDAFVSNFFAQFDKDSNGKLTKKEAPGKMQERFKDMDLDLDGAISRSEMAEAIINARKSGVAP